MKVSGLLAPGQILDYCSGSWPCGLLGFGGPGQCGEVVLAMWVVGLSGKAAVGCFIFIVHCWWFHQINASLVFNSPLVMQAECWFEMSKSDSEGAESAEPQSSEASQVLKERLRRLNEAAAVMSRASVLKNGQMSRNRHSDYEFFLSRS